MSRARSAWGRRLRRRRIARFGLLGVAVAVFTVPLLWTLLASIGIHPYNMSTPPAWVGRPSIDSYEEIGAAEQGFWAEVAASFGTSAVSTALTTAIAFLAAWSLVHSRIRGKRLLLQGFLVLASLPVMAYVIPLDATERALRLHDTFAGLVLAQAAIFAPLGVYVLAGYLARGTPPGAAAAASFDYEEAARLDGASPWRIIAQLALPMNAAGVAATAMILFALNWDSFLAPLVLTTHHVRTLPLAMSDFFTFDRELEWPSAAAALIVSLVPLAALAAVSHRALQRFFLAAGE